MIKILYNFKEQISSSIEGTIIDFETIGEFNESAKECERYKDIIPVLFGTLNQEKIQISYIKSKDHIPALVNTIRDKINELTPPLYAFQNEFEKCIIYHFLGLKLEFQELQPQPFVSKRRVCEDLCIPNYEDPFNGVGILCSQAWLRGEYEDCIKHNRACLLKEADIWLLTKKERDKIY